MKRMIILALMLISIPTQVRADDFHKAEATAYCLEGKTASGVTTQECVAAGRKIVASKPEWIGSMMLVWEDTGNGIEADRFLGMYEILDTGSKKIKSGEVIDVYIPNYEDAKQFGRKKVIFQIVKGEG